MKKKTNAIKGFFMYRWKEYVCKEIEEEIERLFV